MAERKDIATNMLWRLAERFGAQGVSFVIQIILARLLAPEIYGTVALSVALVSVIGAVTDCGLSTALVQKKDADDLDFSTVFYFNVVLGSMLYSGVFLCAPWLARFFQSDSLSLVFRVHGMLLLSDAIKNVQTAYVGRTMQFKRFFFATLGGTIGAAVLGIVMAYRGYGIWALVFQYLFNEFVDTAILWLTVKWRPKWMFSASRLKALFAFGWKVMATNLLETIYNSIHSLVIGKLYSKDQLGHYNRGNQFPWMVVNNVSSAIDSVLLSAMSKEQDEKQEIRAIMRKTMKVSTYVMAPMLLGMAVVGEPMICLFLTEKWLPCLPYIRIFCIAYLFAPMQTANLNAIKAIGRSDLLLKLEIAKKVLQAAALLIFMRYGVLVIALSQIATNAVSQLLNCWTNKKLLDYGWMDQLRDVAPAIGLSVVMAFCIAPMTSLGLPSGWTLLLQIAVGAGIFVSLSAALRMEAFAYLWNKVLSLLGRK